MKKQVFAALALLLLLFSAFALVKYLQISAAIAEGQKHGPPPDAVTTVIAEEQAWPVTAQAVGSLSAVDGAMLSTEELGRVVKINFESSTKVEAGQLLVALDTSVEEAELESAKAQLTLAQINAKRQRELRNNKANSQSELDNAEAVLRQAAAKVAMTEAQIARKKVIAPFEGHAGIRKVNLGQMVPAGTEVVSLQSYKSLYVNFSLPQKELSRLKEGQVLEVRFGGLSDRVFKGRLTSIDSEINTVTRNIMLQGEVENSEELLRPGMFVDVRLYYGQDENYVTVPISSVLNAPYGDSAFIVLPGEGPRPVKNVPLRLGAKRGDQVAVLSGISPGDEVATSAVFKLRPDSLVIVNNSVTPGNDPDPTPKNE